MFGIPVCSYTMVVFDMVVMVLYTFVVVLLDYVQNRWFTDYCTTATMFKSMMGTVGRVLIRNGKRLGGVDGSGGASGGGGSGSSGQGRFRERFYRTSRDVGIVVGTVSTLALYDAMKEGYGSGGYGGQVAMKPDGTLVIKKEINVKDQCRINLGRCSRSILTPSAIKTPLPPLELHPIHSSHTLK